jgi:hypothetical protein
MLVNVSCVIISLLITGSSFRKILCRILCYHVDSHEGSYLPTYNFQWTILPSLHHCGSAQISVTAAEICGAADSDRGQTFPGYICHWHILRNISHFTVQNHSTVLHSNPVNFWNWQATVRLGHTIVYSWVRALVCVCVCVWKRESESGFSYNIITFSSSFA